MCRRASNKTLTSEYTLFLGHTSVLTSQNNHFRHQIYMGNFTFCLDLTLKLVLNQTFKLNPQIRFFNKQIIFDFKQSLKPSSKPEF